MGIRDFFRKRKYSEVFLAQNQGPRWRIGLKESKAQKTNLQSGIVKYPPENYYTYANETYMMNVIAYRCIEYKSTAVMCVDWELKQNIRGKISKVEEHPINNILINPNPNESYSFLMYKLNSWLDIAGNSFLEQVRPETGPNQEWPVELYILRPDLFVIYLDSNGAIKKYVYNNLVTYDVNTITGKADVLQINLFNPINDFWGASPTTATAREIDGSNEATTWQKKMFENEGRPGMILKVNGQLNDKQFDRYSQQMNRNHRGAQNAGKTLILESDREIDVIPYSWNPKEMDWIESNRENARRICLGYGVPPQLIGIPGDNTYSNYETARLAFWEDTVIPRLDLIKAEKNNWFFGKESDLSLEYNLNKIAAIQDKQAKKWEQVRQADFLTINEKREMLGFDAIEGGDSILVPLNLIPLGSDVSEKDEDSADKSSLLKQGYSHDEIQEMLGLPK